MNRRFFFTLLCASALLPVCSAVAGDSKIILENGRTVDREPQSVVPINELIARLREADGMRPRATQRIAEEFAHAPVSIHGEGNARSVSQSPLSATAVHFSGGSGVHIGGMTSARVSLPSDVQSNIPVSEPHVVQSASMGAPVSNPVAPVAPELGDGREYLSGRKGSGCQDRGLGTVVDPSCIARLAPVPSVISKSAGGGVPLPDMGYSGGYPQGDAPGTVSSEAAVSALSSGSSVSVPMSGSEKGGFASDDDRYTSHVVQSVSYGGGNSAPRDVRISCAVSDASGLVSNMKVSDVRSCVVAGTELLSASNGPFSITMVDYGGSVVAVSCRAYGAAARPVCSVVR